MHGHNFLYTTGSSGARAPRAAGLSVLLRWVRVKWIVEFRVWHRLLYMVWELFDHRHMFLEYLGERGPRPKGDFHHIWKSLSRIVVDVIEVVVRRIHTEGHFCSL